MRIPDVLKNTAVFIGIGKRPNDPNAKFGGTGFFVSIEEDGVRIPYLVTADHVRRQLVKNPAMFPVARMNAASGKAYNVELHGVKWHTHPTDPGVDAAVCAVGPSQPGMPSLGRGVFVHTTDIGGVHQRYGIGDEVAVVGLFRFLFNKTSNVPIVRTGNLAMCPYHVRIPVSRPYMNTEGYLIEMRSLGGLSGSPVFISETVTMQLQESGNSLPKTGAMRGSFGFLGIAVKHWDIKPETLNAAFPEIAVKGKGVNIGVAIITPAYKILEIIDNNPEARDERRKLIEMAKKKEHDEAPKPTDDSELGDERARFERLGARLFQVKPKTAKRKKARKKKR